MKIAIKNPAPEGDEQFRWGDLYFGNALRQSLARQGVSVTQDFWPSWDKGGDEAEVVLVLRGKRPWTPPKGVFSVLWNISHPADIPLEEMQAYDLILTASSLHRDLCAAMMETPVRVARQCTEFDAAKWVRQPIEEQAERREGIYYVANSRGQRRDMARWIAEFQVPVEIYGSGWDRSGVASLVQGDHFPNDRLPELYGNAQLVLNDHWADMRAFGIINNRILDCLACGVPVLSDSFPEIREIFGDALLYAHDAESFREQIDYCRNNYETVLRRAQEFWEREGATFTFDYRAEQILGWIDELRTAENGQRAYRTPPTLKPDFYHVVKEASVQYQEAVSHREQLLSSCARENRQKQKQIETRETRLKDRAAELESTRKELQATREELQSTQVRLQTTQEQLQSTQKQQATPGEHVDRLNERVRHVEQRERRAREDRARLQRELTRVKAQLRQTRIELSDENRYGGDMRRYAAQLRERLVDVYASNTWRLGAPLRILKQLLRGRLYIRQALKPAIPDWPDSESRRREARNPLPDDY